MLGYGKAANVTFSSTYGYVPIPYAFDDVICEGTETSLEKCQHRDQVATLSYKTNIVNCTKIHDFDFRSQEIKLRNFDFELHRHP